MMPPAVELLLDERVISAKKHKLHVFARAQTVAIRALSRRARQHGIFTNVNRSLDLLV